MKKRFLLIALAALLAMTGLLLRSPSPLTTAAQSRTTTARKPNIIFIVADDLGYADLGVQGCKDIPTPNVDTLAKNGVRFTNGYVTCPVCSPTRAGLMTGRYQQRFGHEFNPGPAAQASQNFGLPLSETTIAERLKTLGYATAMFGKWHLGYRPELLPTKRGFDEFFGFPGGAHSYLNAKDRPANPIMRGTERVTDMTYTTDEFAHEAVSFMERHQKEAFFIYLPFNAVHAPLETIEKYRARFTAISDPKRRTYAAMLSALDDGVGNVLAKLRELKLEENTLVFFLSDNGGPTPQTTSSNLPLRGYKTQVLEGGIRIPFLVQWKGQLPAGKVYDLPVSALDLHPTAIAAAGGKLTAEAKLDGVNLLPFLTGEKKGQPHEQLFWRFGEEYAVRAGDWKLVKDRSDAQVCLYNLAADIGEKTDLSAQRPEKAKELQTLWETWNAQLSKPRWVRGGDGE